MGDETVGAVLRDTLARMGEAVRLGVARLRGARRRRRELVRACAWCKRVRDDRNEWRELDTYLRQRFGIDFTHGICRVCLREQAPGETQLH
jgi:hypothetical protein